MYPNNQNHSNISQPTNGNEEEPEQTRVEAQRQREEAITSVIVNLFDKLGYKCDIQPEFPKELSPDMLVETDGQKIIIELKAYFKRMVCAEPEVAQAIKYAQAARDAKFAEKIRVLLITSGNMIPVHECGFFCGGDPVEHTIARYTKLKQENKLEKGLDKWDARGIYSRAEEKVRKVTWTPNEFPAVDIHSHNDLLHFINEDPSPVLLGCVSIKGIEDSLKHLDLKFELQAFKRLENTPLRVLMNHERILQIRRRQAKEEIKQKQNEKVKKNGEKNGVLKEKSPKKQQDKKEGQKSKDNHRKKQNQTKSPPKPRNPFM